MYPHVIWNPNRWGAIDSGSEEEPFVAPTHGAARASHKMGNLSTLELMKNLILSVLLA